MYAWIFRQLPVRIAAAVLLAAGAVLALMEFVFPWISQFGLFEGDSAL